MPQTSSEQQSSNNRKNSDGKGNSITRIYNDYSVTNIIEESGEKESNNNDQKEEETQDEYAKKDYSLFATTAVISVLVILVVFSIGRRKVNAMLTDKSA